MSHENRKGENGDIHPGTTLNDGGKVQEDDDRIRNKLFLISHADVDALLCCGSLLQHTTNTSFIVVVIV